MHHAIMPSIPFHAPRHETLLSSNLRPLLPAIAFNARVQAIVAVDADSKEAVF